MIQGRKIVAWVPYGREVTVSILVEYIRRDVERGLIDEFWLYMNTGDSPDRASDIAYAHKLDKQYPWIKLKYRPEGVEGMFQQLQRYTGFAYREMTDPNTVYIRFDDDIVYVHEDAVARLVKARLANQAPVAMFPVILNNAICSWYLQKHGRIPTDIGEVEAPFCMSPVGWASGDFAIKLHNIVLGHIDAGSMDKLELYQDVPLAPGTQFSVSCFASLGSLYAGLETPGVLVPDEEESFHTVAEPVRIGVPNIIAGNAYVVHLSFFPQRGLLLLTDILDRYRQLSKEIN